MRPPSPIATRLIGLLIIGFMTGWLIGTGQRAHSFGEHCVLHLKEAAGAESLEVARRELTAAVSYLNRQGFDAENASGGASEVALWIRRLQTARYRLEGYPQHPNRYEEGQALRELRRALVDVQQTGQVMRLDIPVFAYLYPDAATHLVTGIVLMLSFGIWVMLVSRQGLF